MKYWIVIKITVKKISGDTLSKEHMIIDLSRDALQDRLTELKQILARAVSLVRAKTREDKNGEP